MNAPKNYEPTWAEAISMLVVSLIVLAVLARLVW